MIGLLACALAPLACADSASAGWSNSVTVTGSQAQYSFGQDVGSEGQGAVVWSAPVESGSDYAVFERGVSKAGSLGARQEISQSPTEAFYTTAYHPAIRYAADGTATVVWLQSSYSSESCFAESKEGGGEECEVDEYVEARQIAPDGTLASQTHDLYHRHAVYPAGGPFGATSPAYVAYGQPAMAAGPGETITVAWPQSAFAEGCQGYSYSYSYSYADEGCEAEETIKWVRLNSSGEAEGAPQTAFSSETSGYGSGQPLMRMRIGAASDGTATVLLGARVKTEESECWGGQSAVEVLQISTGGEATTAQELNSGCGTVDPRLVVQPDGTAVAAWSWGGTYSTDEALYARIASDGTPGEAGALLGEYTGTQISGLDLARGLAGSTVAVWAEDGTINSREIPPSGSPGSVRTVASPASGGYLSNPRIALAPDGTGAAVWEAQVSEGGYATGLQGTELAADGTPGNVRTLLSANRWDHGARVSAGGDGSVMASWRVSVPHENKLQAVRLSTEATTSNDDFAEAQVLDPELPSFAAGSNEGATKETEEPNHAGDSGGASVWYSWTAQSSGPVAISTCASGSLDTLLGVYTGTAVNELSAVASADSRAASPCSTGDSEVRFEATSGTTYLIAVDGKGGTEGSFGLKINARDHVPINDDFASAKSIPSLPWSRTEKNVDASKEAGEPSHAGNPGGASVWYSWTAAHTGEVLVAACGYGLAHPLLGIYTGTEVGSLTEVGSADGTGDRSCGEEGSGVRVNAVAGATYKIAVDGRNGHEGRFNLRLYERPANDDFAAAQTLSGIPTSVYSNNYAATKQSEEPEIEGNPGGASVWYSWTPSGNGTAYVSACMYGNTALLGVYTGSSIGGLTEVGTDAGSGTKNGCYNHFSEVQLEYSAGTKYHILLDGKDGAESSFSLSIEKPPANDDFAGAQALGSSPPQFIYSSNRHATRQSEEPEIEGNSGGASVWYSWTPTSNGTAFLSACMSASKHTLLGVYTGSSLATLSQVGADAGTGSGGCYGHKYSEVQFEFASGTTYYIAIDGEDGERGSFSLSLESLPANDDFENAQTLGGSLPQHVYGSNRRATRQSEEPEIEGNPGGASLWYSWTPTSNGIAATSACPHTSKHALLGVYTGSSLATLSQVGADAGTGSGGCYGHKYSEVQFEFASGTTYYIAIDGEDGAEAPFELAIETQTTGWISGTVTSASTHEGLPNASVCAYSSDGGGHTGCASTGSTGEYTIPKLPVGEYKVEFYPGYECGKAGCTPRNYLTQYYDGKESWEEADPVTVALGETTAGIDAELVVGGQIAGTVTDAETEAPIEGVEVCAYEFSSGEYARCASTGAEGHYSIQGLPAGEYRVELYPPYESAYVRQYYDGRESWEEADPVTVNLGETIAGIDAELVAGGQIAGTVTDALSHEAIKGVEVCAYEFSSGEYARCASTNPEGHYTIKGLLAGEYRVEFWAYSSEYGYLTQYYDGKESWEEADPVTVVLDETTSGIDAALQPGAGRIAGTVTDAETEAPIGGVNVCAYKFSSGEFGGCASTDGEGHYSIHGLPAGEYRVEFYPPYESAYVRQYYDGKESWGEADPVTVGPGETTSGIDAELEAGGQISGTVTDASSHEPIAGVDACANDFSSGEFDGCASTDAEGHYSIHGLPAGEYRVELYPPYESFYLSQYYDGKESWGEADPVTVGPGETTSGIDAELVPRGHISGTVTDAATHEPLEDVYACLYKEHAYYYGYCAYTDEEGNYTITGLPAGEYEVQFNPPSGEYGLLAQYYDGKESLEEADPVSVSVGETTSGIDAALQPSSGHISGTVTDAATHEPLEDVYACLYKEHAYYYGYCAYTDEEGNYTITGLPAGEYEVQFYPPYESGYTPQYYDGKESLEEADPVSVALGETTSGIDAALEVGGSIAGTVTLSGKESIEEVEVCAYDYVSEEFGGCAYAGEEGHYEIAGLPAGEYRVEFWAYSSEYGYLTQYYDGKESWEEADPVTVNLGETTAGIDATMQPSTAHVAGTVTDASSHEPVQGVYVCAHEEGGTYNCAYTDEEGNYTITGLPAGEYEVQFNPSSESGYAPQLYDGKDDLEEADPVSVALGETTAGIDAALEVGATVSGTATDALSKGPVEGVYVCAEEQGEGERFYPDYYYYGYRCSYTGEKGHYEISGLPAGQYKVRFSPPSGEYDYVTQYYNGKESLEEADLISLALGEAATGIDAALGVSAGHISGTVTDASTHEPLEGVYVCAHKEGGTYNCDWTGEEGHYTITGLPAGEYAVQFEPPYESPYAPQFYDGKDSLKEADQVSVALGETASGIDAELAELPPPPANVSPPTVSGEALQGETLTEHHGSWENEPESYEYQWLRCDGEGNGCESISGATEQEYALTGADVGHAIAVQETAVNAGGSGGPATSTATAAVLPSPPLNTAPPTVTGTARQGETLTEHHGSWENEPENYEYQWLSCDKSGAGCEPISGETADEYALAAGDVGHTLRVMETATNAGGSSEPATSGATSVVTPPAPVSTSPPTIAGTAQQGQTLLAAHGSWTNSPSGYSDHWLRCDAAGEGCEPISGASGPSYVIAGADVGHTLVLSETASNAGGTGEAAKSEPTDTVSGLPLHADAGEGLSAVAGAPLVFDGGASTPAGEIDSYEWSFGDGEEAAGETVTHAYSEPGTYKATLTVKRGGEEDADSVAVHVLAPPAHHVEIVVTDEAETPIPGAQVLYVAPGGTRTEAITDGGGKAELADLPDGTDTVYAWKGGYKPATGQVAVADGAGEATIELAEGAVVASTLTSKEMTPEEIEEAGIDPSDPANNQVFEFEVALAFKSIEFHGYVNKNGDFVGVPLLTGGGGGWTCTFESCSDGEVMVYATMVEGHPLIEWLILHGKASILKQFFDVSMVVQNLADEPFSLSAGSATLSLPKGLSLAPTAKPQSLSQSVGPIPAQSSATVDWIVRGDEAGEYNLSAEYQASLEPFEAPVSVLASTAEPLKVWGADALALKVRGESGKLAPGRPYHVEIGVTNEADVPLYNVAISIDSEGFAHFIFQPDQQFTETIGELSPGETFFAHEYILIPDGSIGGKFDPSLSHINFVGEEVKPGEGIEEVPSPPLYEIESLSGAPGLVHLHWESVPGAEGYEVFSTPDLETPFEEEPDSVLATSEASEAVQTLPSGATDAYVAGGKGSRYYAVSSLIEGRLTLDKQVIEAEAAGSASLLSLAVSIEDGEGTVASEPAGIACGAECEAEFEEGRKVTLTASPTPGYAFKGWRKCDRKNVEEGLGVNGRKCTVAMSQAKTVGARFVKTWKLTAAKATGSGSGTIQSHPGGIVCLYICSIDTAAFKDGAQVEVVTKPAPHFHFVEFTEGTGSASGCAGSPTCSFQISADSSVEALFEEDRRFVLGLTKEGSGSGTVKSHPAGVVCAAACTSAQEAFYEGTPVELTATAAKGSEFAEWTGACSGSSATCTVSMSEAREVGAAFTFVSGKAAGPTQALTVGKAAGSTGSGKVVSAPGGISCDANCLTATGAFKEGATVKLKPIASKGSEFAEWSGACTGSGACTVTMSAAVEVKARFSAIPLETLTVSEAGGGTGVVKSKPAGAICGATCSTIQAAYQEGTLVELTAVPGKGSTLASWSGCSSESEGQCLVAMDAAKSVTATFE